MAGKKEEWKRKRGDQIDIRCQDRSAAKRPNKVCYVYAKKIPSSETESKGTFSDFFVSLKLSMFQTIKQLGN